MKSRKDLQNYKKQLNATAARVAKQPVHQIKMDLHRLNKTRMSPAEKQMIIGNVYKRLTPNKRNLLGFGQTTPQTMAAQTAAATQAVTQAVTQAPVTAAMTQAAPSAGDAVGFGPPVSTLMPSASVAPATMAAITQAAPATVTGTVTTGSYNQAAGAIQGAEQALLAAGQQLAAAQGVSGYGRRKKSRRTSGFGGLYDI